MDKYSYVWLDTTKTRLKFLTNRNSFRITKWVNRNKNINVWANTNKHKDKCEIFSALFIVKQRYFPPP